jgi:hypothetical protein
LSCKNEKETDLGGGTWKWRKFKWRNDIFHGGLRKE